MENINLKLFNKLVDSAEGLEVSFKVGKECELNVKGNFMAMAKVVGLILEKESLEARGRESNTMEELRNELDEFLNKI